MTYILYFFHIIVSVFLILVVLLQQGKGADLSVFGGGSTQAAFGARGAATLLHKLTVAAFVIFTLTTLSISLFTGEGSSVTADLPSAATTAPATTDTPAAETPVPAAATSTGAALTTPSEETSATPSDVPANPPPAESAPTPNPVGGT